jgi:hypothetical protein
MNKNTFEFVPVSDEQLIQNPQLFVNLVPFSQRYQCCHLRPIQKPPAPSQSRDQQRNSAVVT